MPKYLNQRTNDEEVDSLIDFWRREQKRGISSRRSSPAAARISQRHQDLIVFATGFYDPEKVAHNKAVLGVADGLATMGASVCIVNPDHERIAPHNEPVPTDNPLVHYMYTQEKPDVFAACSKFDYVLVVVEEDYRIALANTGCAKTAERFIAMSGNATISKDNPLRDRAFFLAVTPNSTSLALDEKGYPVLVPPPPNRYNLKTENYMPVELSIPVIGCYCPGVDNTSVAKAVLGIGDPREFYIRHRDIDQVTKKSVQSNSELAYFIGTGAGMVPFATGLIGLFETGNILFPAIGFSVAAASIACGINPRLLSFLRKKPDAEPEIQVEEVYPPLEEMHTKYALSAPPLGQINDKPTTAVQPGAAMYMGDLLWAQTCERYDLVLARWNAYELDITKMLDAPLMVDYSCDQTVALVRAMHKARDLRTAVDDERSRAGRSVAVVRGLFAEAVGEMEIAFEVAEKHAIKVGLRGFAESERKKIATSKKLFAIAADSGSSDHERLEALKRARKELEGILVVPEVAIRQIESAGSLRTLTSTTEAS